MTLKVRKSKKKPRLRLRLRTWTSCPWDSWVSTRRVLALIVGTKIVGVQYYRGIATLDENLLLIREPRNQYDRNAIRVDNVANIQVGQYTLFCSEQK